MPVCLLGDSANSKIHLFACRKPEFEPFTPRSKFNIYIYICGMPIVYGVFLFIF